MIKREDEFLWVERYRPRTVEECILPPDLKKTFKDVLKTGALPNMMFAGPRGTGKTTIARALCEALDVDYIMINGSKDAGISVLRNEIEQFASSVSFGGGDKHKVVILDEADYLNAQSTQVALRGFIEEFSSNCRFIFTCNYPNRIIPELHSRCSVYEFKTDRKMLPKLMALFFARLKTILETEGVKYDEKVVAELIRKFAPDWRRIINECQRYSVSGEIDSGLLSSLMDVNMDQLMKFLREKDFKSMRKWVAETPSLDGATLFRAIYDSIAEYAKPTSVPQVVLILGEYQFKHAFVADAELNIAACLTELMASTEWK